MTHTTGNKIDNSPAHRSGLKIGTFMIAIGAIIEHVPSGKILIQQRADAWQKNEWEVPYGRIDQFEELTQAIKREVFEETGLSDLSVHELIRIWHIFRGERSAENEVYGFTFHCKTHTQEIQLSTEHFQAQWLLPTEAIKLITIPGIKYDLECFIAAQKKPLPRKLILGGINITKLQEI